MQVSEKIDQLIKNLQLLKPSLTNNSAENKTKFNSILQSSLDNQQLKTDGSIDEPISENRNRNDGVLKAKKDTFFGDYAGGKPNMRQLIESLSGQSLEAIEDNSKAKRQEYSKLASELLYGVVGSNLDSRDWPSIMASDDIIGSARRATGVMYQPVIDISNEVDDQNNVVEQFAVVKQQSGKLLRSLNGSATEVEESMINFGASENSIPGNLFSIVAIYTL